MRVFIGWDKREELAYRVCAHSINLRSSKSIRIQALRQEELRNKGLYWREVDPLASTEFTYTRFLVPTLAAYSGWAMYVDCDFLFTDDIWKLLDLRDDQFAVLCVKHDYRPKETTKMDGVAQTVYPRKNWSSLILWNCGHEANRHLTAHTVNSESGAFLHRFKWLTDDLIGGLPEEWNWLEGWSERPRCGTPKGIHFTRGGPWFPRWENVDYAELWNKELESLK